MFELNRGLFDLLFDLNRCSERKDWPHPVSVLSKAERYLSMRRERATDRGEARGGREREREREGE